MGYGTAGKRWMGGAEDRGRKRVETASHGIERKLKKRGEGREEGAEGRGI